MPQSKQGRRKGHGEIIPPLSKQELIEDCLKIQLETFPQKELSPGEIERWGMDLNRYSEEAIKFAFEEHRQLAIFFPVPGQIIDLCKTWIAPQAYRPGCNSECRDRHGRGYGENDVLYLWERYQSMRDSLPNRPLNAGEINALYDDLDEKRGQAPAWRA
jgi:hypothetical protein